LAGVPATPGPLQIRKARVAAKMHAEPELDQPVRPPHQGGEQRGRKHVDGS
jgi:hypothetical protein